MTTAILSFILPGRVTFRCDALLIDERRELEADPPFAAWSKRYIRHSAGSDDLLDLGIDIGRWLDGPQQWLAQLLHATAPVILEVQTDTHPGPLQRMVLDAPWELIAHVEPAASPGDRRAVRHLAHDPGLLVTCVRRLGAASASHPPSDYRLTVGFLAAQPDGMAGLDTSGEELAIRRATGAIGLDLAVEDSGTLERLAELVAELGDCDVVHISSHGSESGEPALVLEGPLGEPAPATAAQLSLRIGQKPRLAFLSACYSGDAGHDLWSLSADLVRRGWPAVLGWSTSVTDSGAIALGAALYRQLALRLPLVEAIAQARLAFALGPRGAEWHMPRLFLGPAGGGPIVAGTRPRSSWPDVIGDPDFLDPRTRQVRIAPFDQRFDNRRALQRVLVALHEARHHGVVIHGANELARASLAARVLRRRARELPRVVVTRDLDASAILGALCAQTASGDVERIAASHRGRIYAEPSALLRALRAILEGPCRDAAAGAIALVIHGFDPPPDAAGHTDARRTLALAQLLVARAVVGAFSGARTASRLLFTSAAPFAIPSDGADLADGLFFQSLDAP